MAHTRAANAQTMIHNKPAHDSLEIQGGHFN